MVEIARDWYDQILPLEMRYRMNGLDVVVEYLRKHPLPMYEERKAVLLEKWKNTRESAQIEQEYAVNEQNAEIVRRLSGNRKNIITT